MHVRSDLPEGSVQEVGQAGRRGQQLALVLVALVTTAGLAAGGVAAIASTSAASTSQATRPTSGLPAAPAPAESPNALVVQAVQPRHVYLAQGDSFFQRGTVLQRDPKTMFVSKDISDDLSRRKAAALLVVMPLVQRPKCMQEATLVLDVAAISGTRAEVGVYPGAATSLVEGRLPPAGDADVTRLVDNRPRGVAEISGGGSVRVDVTALAKTWAAGGPFPSMGREIESGKPLLLVLRPTDAAAGAWTVRLASAPTLTYLSKPDCRAP